jgi:hypothetical protein
MERVGRTPEQLAAIRFDVPSSIAASASSSAAVP